MSKRVERVVLSAVVGVAGVVGAVAAGCVSNAVQTPPDVDSGSYQAPDGAFAPDTSTILPPPGDATSPPPDEDAPSVGVDAADAAPPPALVRFAWFVGATGPGSVSVGTEAVHPFGSGVADDGGVPGVDVCVAVHGTGAWIGPLLGSALPAGIQPYEVTAYFPVPAGRYDARIVPAGSTSCALSSVDAGSPAADDGGDAGGGGDAGDAGDDAGTSPSPTDFTSLPAVPAGAALSVVLVNPSSSATVADVFTFTDDVTTSPGKAKVRFINVSEADVSEPGPDAGPDVDAGTLTFGGTYGLGGATVFSPLFNNVTSQEGIDPAAANGYIELDPVSGIDSTLMQAAFPGDSYTQLASDSLNLGTGTILTAFYTSYLTPPVTDKVGGALPNVTPSSGAGVLVWCYDGQPNASSPLLTKCSFVDGSTDSSSSATRFGNFAADDNAPAVDFCLKYHSYGSYVGPFMAQIGATGGIPDDNLSGYFQVHGGFSLDVAYVAAGAADCSAPFSTLTFTTFVEQGGGGFGSVLLTGYATVPGDAGTVPPYDAGPPFDAGEDAGPQPVSTGISTLAETLIAIEDEAYVAPDLPGVRLVHLDGAHPQPMTMAVTAYVEPGVVRPNGVGPLWVLDDVPYGGFSTQPPPIDAYGYATMAAGDYDFTIAPSGWANDVLSDQSSYFAYASSSGIQILACDDWQEWPATAENPLYQQCCVLSSTPQDCAGVVGGVVAGLKPQRSSLRRHGR